MSLDFSANFYYTGTSQIWVKPENVSTAYIYANGAGGGGGSSSSVGGGGAYSLSIFTFLQTDISYNVTVNVGSGGQAPPLLTGGVSVGSDPSGNNQSNGGAGTILSGAGSGGGGGMSELFYNDPSGNVVIKVIAGGGGGAGSASGANGGSSGNIGTLINNNTASSSIGSTGSGVGGGQGGNSSLDGNAGLGGINGGVNGYDFVDTSNVYYYYGGGGGSGGSYAGGGGGSGYGGAAGGKQGGGGGGGSYSNGNTIVFSLGAGGAGGAPGLAGSDGNVTIYWYIVPPIVPQPQVTQFMLNSQHTSNSIYTAPIRTPAIVYDLSFSAAGFQNTNQAVINADGVIYVIGGNGALYAYNRNFTLKWATPFSIPNYSFFGTPALSTDGTLYISSINTLPGAIQHFYAVVDNEFQGSLKWTFSLDANDGRISTSPVLDLSNNLFFGTDQGIIYSVRDGTSQGFRGWHYPSSNGVSIPDGSLVTGTPVFDLSYNKFYYTTYKSPNSNIYALDLSNNSVLNLTMPTQRWTSTINNDAINGAPSIGKGSINGKLYLGTTSSNVYAYDISNGNSLWNINISDVSLSNIAVGSDNRIYLTSQKALNVIDSSNGNLEWTYPIDPSGASAGVLNNSTPLIDSSNNILFGARNSYLYSIDPDQRILNWRYKVGGAIQGMPVLGSNNDIYVGANNARFYDFSGNSALPPTTSAIVPMYMLNVKHTGLSAYSGPTTASQPAIYWQKPFVSGNLYVSPVISISSNGTLYLGSNDGYVYSLNSVDGSMNWLTRVNNTANNPNFTSPNSIYTTPVIGPDSTIYIGSNEGYLFALNPNGTIKWAYSAGYPLQSSPIMDASGSIYFGAGNKVYAVGDGGIEAYSKWLNPFQTNANVNSSPALGPNGYLYFGSDDGYVYAVDSFTGLYKWSFDASGNIPPNPMIPVHPIYTSATVDISGNVVIGTGSYMNGVLYYLNGITGAMIWTKTDFISIKNGPFYNTVAINGDTIYLSTIAYIFSINRLNGVTNWNYYNTNCYYTSVTIDANGTLYFGAIQVQNYEQFTKNDGTLHCVTDNGGSYTDNWKLQVCSPGRLAPPVIGTNETIYISATANNIYAIK